MQSITTSLPLPAATREAWSATASSNWVPMNRTATTAAKERALVQPSTTMPFRSRLTQSNPKGLLQQGRSAVFQPVVVQQAGFKRRPLRVGLHQCIAGGPEVRMGAPDCKTVGHRSVVLLRRQTLNGAGQLG